MSNNDPQPPAHVLLKPGAGSFRYAGGDSAHPPLTVHYYSPESLWDHTAVVFVMHGWLRDGERYRDRWQRHAQRRGFLLLAPEFDKGTHDIEAYNLGGVVEDESDLEFKDEEAWTFGRIEALFNAVRQSLGLKTEKYGIYGHSAGAQFVHRLVLFHPETSFDVAVAANSGWYTLPCQQTSFPYGLADAPVSDERLAKAVSSRLVILLGEADTDETHPRLRRTPEADEQGRHRYQRGETFFEAGREVARQLGVPFGWELATVPNAEHHDRQMSKAAVKYLFREGKTP